MTNLILQRECRGCEDAEDVKMCVSTGAVQGLLARMWTP
jgi:hypothetical protein